MQTGVDRFVHVVCAFPGQKIAVGERVGFFTEEEHVLIYGSVCHVIPAPAEGRWEMFWVRTADVVLPDFFCGDGIPFEEGGCVKGIHNREKGEIRIRPWQKKERADVA